MKLKIGDLELDSQTAVQPFEAERRVDDARSDSEGAPAYAQRAAATFGACCAAAGLAGFVGAIVLTPWFGLLALSGVVLSAASFLTYFLVSREEGRKDREDPSPAADDQLASLRRERLLAELDGEASVDDLVERLGWSQEVVLRTLQQLVSHGELEEDLELDSGVWTYRRRTQLLVDERPLETLSLEERIEAVSQSQPQSTKENR